MVSIIKLIRDGSIESLETNDIINLDNLSSLINKGQTNIEELEILNTQNYNLKILGSNNYHLLKENKHEIPIKYNSIFFGDLLVIKYTIDNKIEDLRIKEYSDLLNS